MGVLQLLSCAALLHAVQAVQYITDVSIVKQEQWDPPTSCPAGFERDDTTLEGAYPSQINVCYKYADVNVSGSNADMAEYFFGPENCTLPSDADPRASGPPFKLQRRWAPVLAPGGQLYFCVRYVPFPYTLFHSACQMVRSSEVPPSGYNRSLVVNLRTVEHERVDEWCKQETLPSPPPTPSPTRLPTPAPSPTPVPDPTPLPTPQPTALRHLVNVTTVVTLDSQSPRTSCPPGFERDSTDLDGPLPDSVVNFCFQYADVQGDGSNASTAEFDLYPLFCCSFNKDPPFKQQGSKLSDSIGVAGLNYVLCVRSVPFSPNTRFYSACQTVPESQTSPAGYVQKDAGAYDKYTREKVDVWCKQEVFLSPAPTALPTPDSPAPSASPQPIPPLTPMPTPQPTPQPALLPTPSPAPLVTPHPTPQPAQMTAQPTAVTSAPTPAPAPPATLLPATTPGPGSSGKAVTLEPTPFPTPLPTPLPTPVPTPHPTPLPTPFPTPLPTPLPTPVPTPLPIPSPTLITLQPMTHTPEPLSTPAATPELGNNPTDESNSGASSESGNESTSSDNVLVYILIAVGGVVVGVGVSVAVCMLCCGGAARKRDTWQVDEHDTEAELVPYHEEEPAGVAE